MLGVVRLFSGGGAAVATKSTPIGAAALGLTYNATAADLVPQGDWRCVITNESPIGTSFTTEIISVSGFPVLTASFDITLLNAILLAATVLAAVCVRLQSSSDNSDQSVVSWSIPIADLIGGSVEARFNVANPSDKIGGVIDATWQLLDLNLNPSFTSITVESNPLAVVVTLQFGTTASGALLKSNTFAVPDLEIDAFAITVTVGFDGTVVPKCNASVHGTLAGIDLDESSTVEGKVESAINSKLAGFGVTPALIQGILDRFFINLMRLNSAAGVPGVANVTGYSVQGDSLVVSYYVRPASSETPPVSLTANA
ncbi:MAG: hypothetical protein ACREE5_05345 [Acetobacteraceae bacterium]